MADVTIIPASSGISAVSGQTGSAADAGTHPPGLSQGSLVSGTIAGRDGSGNYLLKTSQGTFALQSSTPLTYNSDVTIRVGANASGSTSARIVSVNGESFSDFSAPETQDTDTVSSTLLAQAPVAADGEAPSTPATVQAVVTSAPAAATTGPQELANTQLAPGNTVLLRASPDSGTPTQTPATVAAQPQASTAAAATQLAQPQQISQNPQTATVQQQPAAPDLGQPSVAASVTAVGAAAAPVETQLAPAQTVTQATQDQAAQEELPQPQNSQEATSQPQGNQTQAQQAVAAPASAPAPANAPAAAQYDAYSKQTTTTSAPAPAPAASPVPTAPSATTIPAQVVSTDENGNIALQTAQGGINVKASALTPLSAFTPGTDVSVELLTNIATQSLAEAPAALGELASSWQSLKDIITVVNASDPQAATALLNRLPQLGPSFLSDSTGFMTALMQGDARKLLGDDTLTTLRNNGRGDLADKFSAELSELSGTFTAPTQKQMPGWQMLFLPFVYQEALQQARIYVKRSPQKKERAASKQADDTRFVVEVDLSELGPMQMDGLVRKKEKATAFDLVVRSHTAFTPAAQSEITEIYNSAAQMTGFRGSIAFQVTRDFPVKPLEEAAEGTARSITV